MADIFPDSRLHLNHTPRGMVQSKRGTWLPVFCANCGAPGGHCPETSTFLFYLCNGCFAKHGAITGTMAVPDKEFYEKVAQEQMETYGRPLSHNELLKVVAEDSSALSKLLKEAK
jgi:hypothetical protein